jgi:hypothetical protein
MSQCLLLSEQGNAGEENTIRGKLSTSAYLGSRSHYFVAVDGCEYPIEVAGQDSGLGADVSLQRGSEVWLSWARESLVLLPAQ